MLAAIVTPVYLTMQMQNTHAFTLHAPLPYVVVVSLFLFVFPGGAGATLPLAALFALLAVPRLRRVGRATFRAGALQPQRAAAVRRAGRFQSASRRCRSSAPRSSSRPSPTLRSRPDSSRVRRSTCRRRCRRSCRRISRRRICVPSRSPRVNIAIATVDLLSVRARLRAPRRGTNPDRRALRALRHRRPRCARRRSPHERTVARLRYDAQRHVAATVLRAFLDEGHRRERPRRFDRVRLRRRGARPLRIAAGARLRGRSARSRGSRSSAARTRSSRRSRPAPRPGERCSRSPGAPTTRCATRSATRRTSLAQHGVVYREIALVRRR